MRFCYQSFLRPILGGKRIANWHCIAVGGIGMSPPYITTVFVDQNYDFFPNFSRFWAQKTKNCQKRDLRLHFLGGGGVWLIDSRGSFFIYYIMLYAPPLPSFPPLHTSCCSGSKWNTATAVRRASFTGCHDEVMVVSGRGTVPDLSGAHGLGLRRSS